MAQDRIDALLVSENAENYARRRLVVELAEAHRLPAIYPFQDYALIGGLMAYAIDLEDLYRRAADQIGRILGGESAGEIPMYQSTTFQLVLNLTTARMLGITMPPSLLARADEVIE